ncbi:MAG: histidine phosphatase family protein, partial [Patescibacteria group bacterium]
PPFRDCLDGRGRCNPRCGRHPRCWQYRAKFYLVRHGESTLNKKKVHQDHTPELSESGIKQAEKIAERASHLPIQHIISSTYTRAQQTAEVIKKRTNTDIETSELFTERKKPSELSGMSYSDPKTKEILKSLFKGYQDHNHRISDAETFNELQQRSKKALDFLEAQPYDNVLVVSHAGFIQIIVMHILLGEFFTGKTIAHARNMFITNTGITVIRFDETKTEGNQWHVWTVNDHAHLG